MLRYCFAIFVSLPLIIYYVVKIRCMMTHPKDFSEEYRYGVARNMVKYTMFNSRIKTVCHGQENLPKVQGPRLRRREEEREIVKIPAR